MVTVALRVFKWIAVFAVTALVVAWAILAAPFLSEFRQGLVADLLTEQLGQKVEVNDDVSVSPGPTSRIRAAGVQIPSQSMSDTLLAELKLLELDVDIVALLSGRVDLDNIVVDGLQVNLVTQSDGQTSWTQSAEPAQESSTEIETEAPARSENGTRQGNGILSFLRHRTVAFTSIGLSVDDQASGFSFIFDLESLNLDQLDGGDRLGVTGRGTVNGQTFEIDGSYPTGAPFTTAARFGEMALEFNGEPFSADAGGGYAGQLELDTGAFGDFLDVLGLERVLEGSGRLSAQLTSKDAGLAIDELNVDVNLDEGQFLGLTGNVENLFRRDGLDLMFKARFHPEGQPPAKAAELKDLKLTGISSKITGKGQAIEFDQLVLTTNAFDQGLDRVGPVSIGRFHRTPEGKLSMEDVRLQAGPSETPYLKAKGNVRDMLQLRGLDLEGELNLPAALVLRDLGDENASAFGGVVAEFAVDDAQGHLSINRLDARTIDTTLWSLNLHAALGSLRGLDGIEFAFDLGIADGAVFLGALKLDEIDTGPLEIAAAATGMGSDFSTSLGLAAGTSRLDASLETQVSEGRPQIDGRLYSERLDIGDLKNAIAGVVQLGKIGESGPEKSGEDEPEEAKSEDLGAPDDTGSPADLFNLEKMLLESDLKVAIDFEEITGQQGVSSVSSEFVAVEGKAHLGPLEIAYGGGHFNLDASMDLVDSPEILSVSGSTGGWDFGKILDSVGLGIEAHGTLGGKFNLTGNRASARTFVQSMYGSATVWMSEGDIATSLLELAGLGIFPWLFSEELRQGYTEIVCVVAPVKIEAGKVAFDSVVAETKSVQLVAKGQLDWINDIIAVRAEPRRVGKPLGRSAWPFEVTGKLSAPKFKLDVGGSRPKNRNGKVAADRRPCTPDAKQLE